MDELFSIKAFYPNYFSDRQIAYVCLQLVEHLNENGRITARVMGLSSDDTVRHYRCRTGRAGDPRHEVYRDAIPRGPAWIAASRLLSAETTLRFAESRYLRQLRKGDVAYLWPGASLELYKKLKSRGHVIVSERINTLRFNSKMILDREYAALGVAVDHGITEGSVRDELECMELSDYIFSPSPAVTASLVRVGIGTEKILQASFGLKGCEILDRSGDMSRDGPVTAIFVGRICIRKGIHLLLKAWEHAGVDGQLRIVGDVSPEIADFFHEFLRTHDTVEHVGYVQDLKPIFRRADIFILPSLEEGSPLVTYLALGASLPVIVSPMGAGGVITDLKEGLVVDPEDKNRLSGAIRKLAGDASLRKEMGSASGRKAQDYTWDKVGARRRVQLMEKLGR
jgi:glycosyltransferase involved in cell wall biosynthesis